MHNPLCISVKTGLPFPRISTTLYFSVKTGLPFLGIETTSQCVTSRPSLVLATGRPAAILLNLNFCAFESRRFYQRSRFLGALRPFLDYFFTSLLDFIQQ